MIGIRVDANERIAMGHLMRCMSIARQLKANNQKVIFIISEDYSMQQIKESGFQCVCLDNQYNEKDKEIKRLLEIIEDYEIDKLLIDSYEVTYFYMSVLREHCKLIYIDDMNLFCYPADLIINYTFKVDKAIYQIYDYKEERFLLGEKYIPLRPEFSEGSIDIRKQVQNIFLTTGGTDEYDMVLEILRQMQSDCLLKDLQMHVVVGKFYKKLDELKQFASSLSNIQIYYDIPNIANVMRKCDVAISAGGTTLAELCACGIPTVCFSIANNQIEGARAYGNEGLMIFAGIVMNGRTDVVENVMVDVKRLIGDYELRKSMSQRAHLAIDGKGAIRIAEEIRAYQ